MFNDEYQLLSGKYHLATFNSALNKQCPLKTEGNIIKLPVGTVLLMALAMSRFLYWLFFQQIYNFK